MTREEVMRRGQAGVRSEMEVVRGMDPVKTSVTSARVRRARAKERQK